MKKWQKRSMALLLAMLMTATCTVFGMTAFAVRSDVPDGWGFFNGIIPATTTADGEAEWESQQGEIDQFLTRKIKSVELPVKACQYVGKPRVQKKVIVKDSAGKIIDSRYYKVFHKNNTYIGTASVTVDFNKGMRREQGVDDPSGMTLYEGTVTKTFKIYMAAPRVVNANKGFKITWTKQAGATGYEVWRSKDGGSYIKAKTVSGGNTTTFTNTADAANVNGSKYQYKIKPLIKNDGTDKFSNVRTSYKVARPTIKTISNSSNGIKLTWEKNSKASGYQIWRSEDGGKTYIKAKTITNPSTTSFNNSAANKKGKTYKYKMRSYKTVSGVNYYSTFSPVRTITKK